MVTSLVMDDISVTKLVIKQNVYIIFIFHTVPHNVVIYSLILPFSFITNLFRQNGTVL